MVNPRAFSLLPEKAPGQKAQGARCCSALRAQKGALCRAVLKGRQTRPINGAVTPSPSGGRVWTVGRPERAA